ncbi:hypothetical protein HanIR_Chr17g0899621 [Helianthus annuus]|nr:hypothetical protein HanIR_Chr17g0899621 [Helianthus annuus]
MFRKIRWHLLGHMLWGAVGARAWGKLQELGRRKRRNRVGVVGRRGRGTITGRRS